MWKDLKPAVFILGRFLVIYFALFFLYQAYLDHYSAAGLDPASRWVASQVNFLTQRFGYQAHTVHIAKWKTEYFYVNGRAATRMIEGCNALSVMILFSAFVLAFYKGGRTFFYVLGGILLIHLANLLRISGINIVFSENTTLGDQLHDYIFPAILYGLVIVLWVIWMKIITKNKKSWPSGSSSLSSPSQG